MGFTIYNASAGSGKTFMLVAKYLSIVLKNTANTPFLFGEIVSITFTNKAVIELKTRILDNIIEFSKNEILSSPNDLFRIVQENLDISSEELHSNAKELLALILHYYSFFSVTTIDKFNTKLVRSFARDFNLASNFKIELNENLYTQKAVDNLLLKTGKDKLLSKILIEFQKEKISSDRSWILKEEILKTLYNIDKIEGIYTIKQQLADISLSKFISLKKSLDKKTQEAINKIKQTAKKTSTFLIEKDFNKECFNRGSFYRFIEDCNNSNIVSSNNLITKFADRWFVNIIEGDESVYTKTFQKKKPEIAEQLDDALPILKKYLLLLKEQLLSYNYLKELLKNLVTTSLFNSITKELKLIKEQENIMFLKEFDTLISEKIKNEPVPFIYERLGERYRYYFIDEFQDTSIIQWENMIPLITHAIESENEQGERGELYIVGDAKQSIYRFRGGVPEQFMNLYQKKIFPFQIPQEVISLDTNYRSVDHIINFNNEFFKYIGENGYLQEIDSYRSMYENDSSQKKTNKPYGFTQIDFIEKKGVAIAHYEITQKVYDIISELINQEGWDYKDICILINKKSEQNIISDFLTTKNIPVVSDDAFLLKNSKDIQFIFFVLQYSQTPNDRNIYFDIIEYLLNSKEGKQVIHQDIFDFLDRFEEVLKQEYNFEITKLLSTDLYQSVLYIIRSFQIKIDSYISTLLDIILQNLAESYQASIIDFMSYFEERANILSVSTTELDAVQLMTVHKSKGLDFPIVIYPYADKELVKYDYLKHEIEDEGIKFPYILKHTKFMELLNENLAKEIKNISSKAKLDSINTLYVCITRTQYHNYIITNTASKSSATLRFSNIFTDYLLSKGLYNEEQTTYTFGQKKPKNITVSKNKPSVFKEKLLPINYNIADENRYEFTF